MTRTISVLGFAGSLRKGSYNRALLHNAKELVPPNMTIEIFELDNIPLYNGDVEAQSFPEPVLEFKNKIRAADALLIAMPEYNYSIPGVLKNSIDWASRPPTDSPLHGKPVALLGASTGGFGTVRGQLQLRQCFIFTKSLCLVDPEVYVSRAHEKFDANGNLLDETTIAQIRSLLHGLYEWTIQLTE
ncbi:MAG TPA: NADPH-dependent FMN reductase [Candidatus Aquicultor sp.]|jgi:chromate reductase